jgi:hypothetical protein
MMLRGTILRSLQASAGCKGPCAAMAECAVRVGCLKRLGRYWRRARENAGARRTCRRALRRRRIFEETRFHRRVPKAGCGRRQPEPCRPAASPEVEPGLCEKACFPRGRRREHFATPTGRCPGLAQVNILFSLVRQHMVGAVIKKFSKTVNSTLICDTYH